MTVTRRTGTDAHLWHCMSCRLNGKLPKKRFRFVTPHRHGKWYSDLNLAQRFANAIGAGFLETRTGQFVLYPGVRLDTTDWPRSRR